MHMCCGLLAVPHASRAALLHRFLKLKIDNDHLKPIWFLKSLRDHVEIAIILYPLTLPHRLQSSSATLPSLASNVATCGSRTYPFGEDVLPDPLRQTITDLWKAGVKLRKYLLSEEKRLHDPSRRYVVYVLEGAVASCQDMAQRGASQHTIEEDYLKRWVRASRLLVRGSPSSSLGRRLFTSSNASTFEVGLSRYTGSMLASNFSQSFTASLCRIPADCNLEMHSKEVLQLRLLLVLWLPRKISSVDTKAPLVPLKAVKVVFADTLRSTLFCLIRRNDYLPSISLARGHYLFWQLETAEDPSTSRMLKQVNSKGSRTDDYVYTRAQHVQKKRKEEKGAPAMDMDQVILGSFNVSARRGMMRNMGIDMSWGYFCVVTG
ncbi:hypothetical protein DFH29DRAFT_1068832 [Suillus ampliporus]|nr:hypothetical protein DFH29DRAFT_1068832 [Suillus ampliporus]